MQLKAHNRNAEFYIASLALGILDGMKQGVILPEVGIWSLARPTLCQEVLKSSIISDDLKEVLECFDEIDVWSSFDGGEIKQQQMIDEMLNRLSHPYMSAAIRLPNKRVQMANID